ncbi:hypothetical protein NS226_13145 [Aureimonas ureilytica]|uniref:Uncharacterized protein n=1 Tax=Aureimonas ureilytica TaxID=401562 RepID=A0A175R921_9HYPH|nr:hypothetical protein [Aureimonas ureilytica]KTQ95129.1 hypothetical protein NS226_13145 [Aureimonas ureilytica]
MRLLQPHIPIERERLLRWRDELVEARLSGVREIQDQNGERIRYASDAEMARAIAAADRMIADATRRPASTIRFATSKGL